MMRRELERAVWDMTKLAWARFLHHLPRLFTPPTDV